ncbi:hypothetical protein N8Z80_02510 [Litorivicinus sp.]|nr:hypothetical protein [Litorivicinus sp.]
MHLVTSSNEAHMLRLCVAECLSANSEDKFHLNSLTHMAESYIPVEKTRTILKQLQFLGEFCHLGHSWYSAYDSSDVSWKEKQYAIGIIAGSAPSQLFPFAYANGNPRGSARDLTEWLGLPLNLSQMPQVFFREDEARLHITNIEEFEFFCPNAKPTLKDCWIKYDQVPEWYSRKPLVGRAKNLYSTIFIQHLPENDQHREITSEEAYELVALNLITGKMKILFNKTVEDGNTVISPLMYTPRSLKKLALICSKAVKINDDNSTFHMANGSFKAFEEIAGHLVNYTRKDQ